MTLLESAILPFSSSQPQPMGSILTFSGLRDWSLITGRGGGATKREGGGT